MLKLIFLWILVGSFALGIGYVMLKRCNSNWCTFFDWQLYHRARTFEECVQAGFPVTDTYPRSCRAGDRVFTEPVPTSPVL